MNFRGDTVTVCFHVQQVSKALMNKLVAIILKSVLLKVTLIVPYWQEGMNVFNSPLRARG